MARCSRASADGRLSPRTTLASSSISRNCAGVRLPLSKPVEVIARRSGSREITALKFPLVPRTQPRAWKPFPISAKQAAASAKRVPFGLNRVFALGLFLRLTPLLVFFIATINILRRRADGWNSHSPRATLGRSAPVILCARSEFDENGHVQPVLGLAKIREPGICWRTVARRESAEANHSSCRASIAARRCHASAAGEIGHIRR